MHRNRPESRGITYITLLLFGYCVFYDISGFSFRRNVTVSVTGGALGAELNKTGLQLRTVYRALIFGNKRGARSK